MEHKHYELIKTYYANPDWWDVGYITPFGDWALTSDPSWAADYYALRKTLKHPNNKPKLKLVDMSKLPRGTMTNLGEIIGYSDLQGLVSVLLGRDSHIGYITNLRIKEQTEFTYWGGGECPVPDGLVVEVVLRISGRVKAIAEASTLPWAHEKSPSDDVIGYRILGVADGWTDGAEEAK